MEHFGHALAPATTGLEIWKLLGILNSLSSKWKEKY